MTLLEMMVTVGLVGVVLASTMAAFLANNRLYKEMNEGREAEQSARQAMSVIARYLSMAGYGMGPEFAFDFEFYDCGGDCDPATTRNNRASGPQIDATGTVNFTGASPHSSDELVFMARNPAYFAKADLSIPNVGPAWDVVAGDSTPPAVTLKLHRDDVVRLGQVLLLVCPGAFTYTYVTAAETKRATGLTKPTDEADVTIQVTWPVGLDPYQRSDALNRPCFSGGRARAFAIDRYHFFVVWDTSDPVSTDPRGRPFLYLDRGVDLDEDGSVDAQDWVPVAADVEHIQVAYVMQDGTVYGGAGALAPFPTQQVIPGPPCSSEVRVPFYKDRGLVACASTDSRRQDPTLTGNIKAVRVTIVARSKSPRREKSGAVNTVGGSPAVVVEDGPTIGGADGYERRVLTRTIEVPHLRARGIPLI